ncbi:MAG TPA: stage II sporulation protein M [Steroidobacteraceae bacterium]|nr:stage II sporulation protein M [Steroidobacteraceae bacterium]
MDPAVSAQAWVRSRMATWNEWLAQSRLSPAAGAQALSLEQARQRIERHRALARDLATARRLLPGSRTTAALEALYLTSHGEIDRAPRHSGAALLRLARDEIPAVMGSLLPAILWIVALLLASAGAGWWLIERYPELISLVASPSMIDQVEHGHLWTSDLFNVVPSSMLSLRILSNNITVTLMMFCSGILLGLGVAYFTALNGLMLGALLAFTHQHGLAGALLTFVAAHGPVELSVMCIAGAAGIALGESVLRPTLPSRRESFEAAARRLSGVLGACALLLIGCGIIEGFISPNPHIPLPLRVTVGVGWWGTDGSGAQRAIGRVGTRTGSALQATRRRWRNCA